MIYLIIPELNSPHPVRENEDVIHALLPILSSAAHVRGWASSHLHSQPILPLLLNGP